MAVQARVAGAPWQIATDVFCVGPHGRTQTNVYLVRAGSSWVLIDTGWAKDGPGIRAAAETLIGGNTRPAAVVLTHCHPDHAGSALELARTWACPVYMHPAELPIASGDFAAMTTTAGPLDHWLVLPMMRLMGQRRREAMLQRSSLAEVARGLEPGGDVPGLPGWRWILTPGHTPGHVALFRAGDRVLIAGDAVVTMQLNSASGIVLQKPGLSGPPRYTSWNWPLAKRSVATLAALEPAVLAGGHGRPMSGAHTAHALRAFADTFTASG